MRLLRSDAPLHRDLRDGLAALFDPDNELRIIGHIPGEGTLGDHHTPNDRKLVFQFRSKKRRVDNTRNTAIVQHVHDISKAGKSVEEAIAEVAGKFNLSEGAVKAIWLDFSKYRKLGFFD